MSQEKYSDPVIKTLARTIDKEDLNRVSGGGTAVIVPAFAAVTENTYDSNNKYKGKDTIENS